MYTKTHTNMRGSSHSLKLLVSQQKAYTHNYIQKKTKLFCFWSDSTHHHRNYLVTVKIPKVLVKFWSDSTHLVALFIRHLGSIWSLWSRSRLCLGPVIQALPRPCSPEVWPLTLQGINRSHLGKRKIIFKMPIFGGYVSSLEGRFP